MLDKAFKIGSPMGQRSSMEAFLDEYQMVRVWLSSIGFLLLVVFALAGSGDDRVYTIGAILIAVATHATWCRRKNVRAPHSMLALDVTLYGWLMIIVADTITIPTASVAFLTVLVVIFADGYWLIAFLAYAMAWYGAAYFSTQAPGTESIVVFVSVVFTVAALAVLMYHVRRWLGRLDANRSQMLGTVSHELRNNLTGMMGLTDLVANDEEIGYEESRELAGLAYQQAVDANEIVEDLLTISRLERSALEVEMQLVDVNDEVATVVRRFAGEGTHVVVATSPKVYRVLGDALRIRQILRNLVSNAVRYGGPNIAISSREADRGDVVVTVSDDGEGVPAEDESTIFLPYRRSTQSRSHSSSVGLGLWICRHLAVAMGGTLEYQRHGGTTEFVFTLRAEPPPHGSLVGAASATVETVRDELDRRIVRAVSV